jgi:uncharacterized protein (DUF1684 family)
MVDEGYEKIILQWRDEADAHLRAENGWLTLVGLSWLEKGFNTFGSSRDCDIHLPTRAPRLLGALEFDGTNVTLHVDIGQSVEVNGQPLQTTAVLNPDSDELPSFVTFEEMRMVIIRRGERFGVRIWDNQCSHRQDFPPRAWFPVDEKFHIPAVYTPYPVPMKVKTPNIFGEMEEDYMQGYVSFKLAGKSCRLDATELEDACLYLQFKDPTNGRDTYPNGRYLHTEAVKEDGQVFLDFNKAYNPPCAFTEYATCTFAPKENHLKIAIEAGELYKGRH